jgi:hypothetical protein
VLKDGNENDSEAKSVTSILQKLIDKDSVVQIDNDTMDGDPCPGYTKHFGAQLTRDGGTFYFACQEGQTIDFCHGGRPA